MKRILIWVFILSFSLAAARAQDDATQQQINELNGHIRDQQETLDAQKKRIDALEKEISELRDKSNGSGANPGANPDDLQKLADQVQELAKKQQADNDLILKEIGKLGKAGGSATGHKPTPNVTTNAPTGGSSAGGKENGYEYKVAAGDTLSIIAKAYREQGIKVTAEQILKANPGLNPNSLKVGQKIFIPAPAQ
jgi:LysM repeat protein